ncbi:helicase HerA-like domain-containing protein [Phytomonospora sp. NPDC050363]|uniref:helicase HerA-like domain-containing protein n=1 Tax=Phytomonospora sp. NPDC050363 TaxID=3155642 RepID=UPI0034061753
MNGLIEGSAMRAEYGTDIDRGSAYEILASKVAEAEAAAPDPAAAPVPTAPKYEPLPRWTGLEVEVARRRRRPRLPRRARAGSSTTSC